jgi:hypothetical protein
MWVDGQDGCRPSDEREGDGGEPKKLLHGTSSLNRSMCTTAIHGRAGL